MKIQCHLSTSDSKLKGMWSKYEIISEILYTEDNFLNVKYVCVCTQIIYMIIIYIYIYIHIFSFTSQQTAWSYVIQKRL